MQLHTKAIKHLQHAQLYAFGGYIRRDEADEYPEATIEFISNASKIRRRRPFTYEVYGVNTGVNTQQCDIQKCDYVRTDIVIKLLNNRLQRDESTDTSYRACILEISIGDPPNVTRRQWRVDREQLALSDDDRDAKIKVILTMALSRIRKKIASKCHTFYLKQIGL